MNVRVCLSVLFCKALVDHPRVEELLRLGVHQARQRATDRNDFALRLLRSTGDSRCRCLSDSSTLCNALRTNCRASAVPGCMCFREISGLGVHRAMREAGLRHGLRNVSKRHCVPKERTMLFNKSRLKTSICLKVALMVMLSPPTSTSAEPEEGFVLEQIPRAKRRSQQNGNRLGS